MTDPVTFLPTRVEAVILSSADYMPIKVEDMNLDQAKEAIQVLGRELHQALQLSRWRP